MDTNQGYKNRALASLSGRWDKGVIATLIALAIIYIGSSALSMPFGTDIHSPAYWNGQCISTIWTLLCLPLTWALAVYFLRLVKEEDLAYAHLFDGYRGFDEFLRIFLTEFLKGLYTFLWTLLLIVPGIIKSYSYAMTDFILKDDPEMKYDAAIERSMQMMQGHKADLFWLDLSFIGWILLSILTCGIGFLLLIPYMETAHAHFYDDLKAQERA